MLRRAGRVAALAVAVPTGVAAAGVACGCAIDPGFRRQVSFWWSVAPGLAHYRYCGWRHKDATDAEYAPVLKALHQRYAPVALGLILQQRGLFIKFGQVCSVRPELVPKEYRDAFRSLQSEVPGESAAVVIGVIEAELGKPLSQLFSRFDKEPVGSASIGQAHTACTLQGEEVCVKVQYPDAAWQFAADIGCLRTLTAWTQAHALPAFEEFAKQYTLELDYCAEMDSIVACHAAIMPKYRDVVAVPQPLHQLCTPKVLTMSYLDGPMLEEEARRQLLVMGVDVDKGQSVRDLLKQGADATVKRSKTKGTGHDSTGDASQEQGQEQQSVLLGSETSAAAGVAGTLGQCLLRWVGLDFVLTMGSRWLQFRGAIGLGAARLIDAAATLGVVGSEHWSVVWASQVRTRWTELSTYGQIVRWLDVRIELYPLFCLSPETESSLRAGAA